MDGDQASGRRLRKKGRFVKAKVLERGKKAAEHRTIQAAQVRLSKPYDNYECVVKGTRIIDCRVLNKNMRCYDCDQKLFFDDIIKEQMYGISSIWSIRCPSCQVVKQVHTSETYSSNDEPTKCHVLNIKLAAAMIDAGIGISQINTILTALNMPAVNQNALMKAENII